MADKPTTRRLLYRPANPFRTAGAFGFTFFTTMVGLGLAFVGVIGLILPLPGIVKFFGLPLALLLVFVPLAANWQGRSAWELAWGRYNRRRHFTRNTHLYRSGPFTGIPDGTPPPGPLATASTFDFHPSDGSPPFGLIALGSRNFYTLKLRAWPQGREWNVPATRDRWVARLGDMIMFLGQAPEFVAMTVTIESLPESGKRASTMVRRRLIQYAPALAKRITIEAVEQVPSAEVRLEAFISLTWRADTAWRKRDATEMGTEISQRMGKIRDYCAAAGVPVRPMREREICAVTRRAFSPGDELDLETGLYTGEPMRLRFEDCGPASASDQHKQYLHDAARSMSWTMKSEPEANFDSNVIHDILAARREIPRKRVTLVYQPYTPRNATAIVNKDHTDARQNIRTNIGKLPERAMVRLEHAEAARAEQGRGAGITRVSMILTATCPVETDSHKVEALVTDLGLAASTPLEPAHDEQLVTFCAGMGMGVILAEETSVSDKLAA